MSVLSFRDPSAALRPKSLKLQASEKISRVVIDRCLPSLRRCWQSKSDADFAMGESVLNLCEKDKNFFMQMKEWYDKNEWFGNQSKIQKLVSEAFAKVLQFLYIGDLSVPLLVFVLQVMFCTEAGFLTTDIYDFQYFNKDLCRAISQFLDSVTPFALETIHTTFIIFEEPTTLVFLLQNSPNLKEIHLQHNLSDFVLSQLRKLCPHLEVIILSGKNEVSEKYLFKMFFKGLDKLAVINCVDNKASCPLSFPNLRRVRLCLQGKNFEDVLFFVQYFYPEVQCNITKVLCEPGLTPALFKSVLDPPVSLQGKETFKVDIIRFVTRDITAWEEYDQTIVYPTVRHLTVYHKDTDPNLYMNAISKARHILQLLGCSSLSHVILHDIRNPDFMVKSLIDGTGHNLSELHLYVQVPMNESTLYICLNNCPNLKLFNINIYKFITDSATTGSTYLKPLPHLTTLSIGIQCLDGSDCDVQYISHLVSAAPSLKVFEVIAARLQKIIKDLVVSGKLADLEILSLHQRRAQWETFQWNVEFCIFLGTHLPSLTILMLDHMSEESRLKIKSYFCYTDLQIVSRNVPFVSM